MGSNWPYRCCMSYSPPRSLVSGCEAASDNRRDYRATGLYRLFPDAEFVSCMALPTWLRSSNLPPAHTAMPVPGCALCVELGRAPRCRRVDAAQQWSGARLTRRCGPSSSRHRHHWPLARREGSATGGALRADGRVVMLGLTRIITSGYYIVWTGGDRRAH
jgi:hypothetical protein